MYGAAVTTKPNNADEAGTTPATDEAGTTPDAPAPSAKAPSAAGRAVEASEGARSVDAGATRRTALLSIGVGIVALLAVLGVALAVPLVLGPLRTGVLELGVFGLIGLAMLLPAALFAAGVAVVSARGKRPWVAAPLALAALAWAFGATGYRFTLARTAVRSAAEGWGARLRALLEDVPDAAGARAVGALVAAGTLTALAVALALAVVLQRAAATKEPKVNARQGLVAALLGLPMALPAVVGWFAGVPTGAWSLALVLALALTAAVAVAAAFAADRHSVASAAAVSACAALSVLALGALLSSLALAPAFGPAPMSAERLASAATTLRGAGIATIVARGAAALVLCGVPLLVLLRVRKSARPGAADLLRALVTLLPIAAVLAWDAHVVRVSDEVLVSLGRHPLATIADFHPLRLVTSSGSTLHDVDLFVTHDRAIPPEGNDMPLPTSDAIDPVFDAALGARVAAAAERGTASDRAGGEALVTATLDPRAAISIAPDKSLPAKHLRRILRAAARAGATGVALYGESFAERGRGAIATLPAALTVFRFANAACVAELPTLAVLREAERDPQLLHAQITRTGPFQVLRREGAGTGFLLSPDRALRPSDLRAPAQRPACKMLYCALGASAKATIFLSRMRRNGNCAACGLAILAVRVLSPQG